MKKRKLILSIAIITLIITGLFYKFNFFQKSQLLGMSTKNVGQNLSTKFAYKGEKGKNASQLLREKAEIKQDQSGMVIGINGREADSKKHEFWAFYINGKMANVGPANYMTQDSDKIEWRIERY